MHYLEYLLKYLNEWQVPYHIRRTVMNTKLFYKIISKAYDLLDVIYFRNYENSPRKAVLDRIYENEKVLDLCAGTATNTINIANKRTNTKIVGIDLSKDMLKIAQGKINKNKLENIRLLQMDATQLKFKSNSFDKILISLVLHELDETLTSKIIMEAKRVLKEDGEIIITEWEPSKRLSKRILFTPIHYLEPKTYHKFIKLDLYSYFKKYGLFIQEDIHCDYTQVLTLKKN